MPEWPPPQSVSYGSREGGVETYASAASHRRRICGDTWRSGERCTNAQAEMCCPRSRGGCLFDVFMSYRHFIPRMVEAEGVTDHQMMLVNPRHLLDLYRVDL